MTEEPKPNLPQKLREINMTLMQIQRCYSLANLTYKIHGEVKSLPQNDKTELLGEMSELKKKLKEQVEALP